MYIYIYFGCLAHSRISHAGAHSLQLQRSRAFTSFMRRLIVPAVKVVELDYKYYRRCGVHARVNQGGGRSFDGWLTLHQIWNYQEYSVTFQLFLWNNHRPFLLYCTVWIYFWNCWQFHGRGRWITNHGIKIPDTKGNRVYIFSRVIIENCMNIIFSNRWIEMRNR